MYKEQQWAIEHALHAKGVPDDEIAIVIKHFNTSADILISDEVARYKEAVRESAYEEGYDRGKTAGYNNGYSDGRLYGRY